MCHFDRQGKIFYRGGHRTGIAKEENKERDSKSSVSIRIDSRRLTYYYKSNAKREFAMLIRIVLEPTAAQVARALN